MGLAQSPNDYSVRTFTVGSVRIVFLYLGALLWLLYFHFIITPHTNTMEVLGVAMLGSTLATLNSSK